MKLCRSLALSLALLLTTIAVRPAFAAGFDFLVDADWLAGQMNNPKLVILEVRYHPHRYFTVGHIPGAIQVQRFKDLGDNAGPAIMRFPDRTSFQTTLRGWGVDDDSLVVLYDDSRTALAARVYYLLALYGYDLGRVKVLDGGTQEWSAFNELVKSGVKPRTGNVTLKAADPKLFVEWPRVYDDAVSRRDPGVALIDARPKDMYNGSVVRHSIQAGHIPGAVNIVSLDGTDGQTQKWLASDPLAQMYRTVPKDKTVYVYCHDGFRMSLAWLQLTALGHKEVRVVNGGWGAWDRAMTLPVVTGDAPYDEEFGL